MQRVEQIEKVFQFQLSALARVEQKQGDSEKRIVLHATVYRSHIYHGDGGGQHVNGVYVQTLEKGGGVLVAVKESGKHGHNTAREAVVKIEEAVEHVGQEQKQEKGEHGCCLKCRRDVGLEQYLFAILQCVDQKNSHREGNENRHLIISESDKIDQLTDGGNGCHSEEIAELVACVATALGYHKGEDREGETADYTEHSVAWKEDKSHVVYHHSHSGYKLQSVSTEKS